MPPRIRLRPRTIVLRVQQQLPHHSHSYASLATATTPSPPIEQTSRFASPVLRFNPAQPPSHKPAEVRKTQLHRQYQSLLKSSPLILLFQHNNVKAIEWMGIRRELAQALKKVDDERTAAGSTDLFGDAIKIQIIQTGIFASALRIVEFYHPVENTSEAPAPAARIPDILPSRDDPRLTHGLSRTAYKAANKKGLQLELDPLLSGPLAVVAFPAVAPEYLKAVLSILFPNPDFKAPTRKTQPSLYEPDVQFGLQKLMLLAARVEGKVFDQAGTRWVGGIAGGIDGLRGQLVAMLQGLGAGITNTLESASRSLYFTVEGRRTMLEEEEKEGNKGEEKKE
ncbi:hypothetical protein GQ43DRAFT_391616 [Delitschia confertaspora ATCC 74209]|uniref:Uncharacterized protein n=1 Tax=Delitschia confertaspora ATCC 74209 TaxID=1513339 RepID=A0A9P4MX12_9PLEO|nr:hypothetical protein GQ43DRAFT_391616 [Delitschia confertaspora ATCC 74209]